MQKALLNIQTLLFILSQIWNKQAGPSDFVWLARFRLLAIYVILKGVLLLIFGLVGMRLNAISLPFPLSFILLHWIITILSITAIVISLLLGLIFASKRKSRFAGIIMLCIADFCVILAVFCACILGSPFLLLLEFAIISCTTPLFVERISRYAKSYEHTKYELMSIQHKLDMLLRRYSQELARDIQSERLSLSRELHDGLMQELSTVLLQLSTTLMRNSADGNVQLSAAETANLEASLRRVVAEARSMMQELKTPQSILEQ
jgi:signal transduction histidine kinase